MKSERARVLRTSPSPSSLQSELRYCEGEGGTLRTASGSHVTPAPEA